MLAFILCCIAAAVCSNYEVPEETLEYVPEFTLWVGGPRFNGLLTRLLYGVAFFIAACFLPEKKEWLLWGMAASFTALSMIGIIQAFGINVFHLYPGSYTAYNSNFYSTIGNQNMVSGMLCLGLPAFCAAFLCMQQKRRYWLLVPACLCFYFLLAIRNDSGIVGIGVFLLLFPLLLWNTPQRIARGGLLYALLGLVAALWRIALPYGDGDGTPLVRIGFGKDAGLLLLLAALAGGMGLAAYLLRDKIKWSKRQFTLLWAACLLLLLIAGVLAFLHLELTNQSGFLYEAQQMLLHGNWDDHFGTGRIFLWKRTLPLVLQHPVLGTGPDTFAMVFQGNYLDDVIAYYGRVGPYFDTAHNEYLDILIQFGILGGICYVALLVTLLVRALRHKESGWAIPAWGCSVLCYCVQAFFSFSIVLVAPIFWLMMGLLEGEICLAQGKPPITIAPRPRR